MPVGRSTITIAIDSNNLLWMFGGCQQLCYADLWSIPLSGANRMK